MELVKYTANIDDKFSKLASNMVSNEISFLKETYGYILKENSRLSDNPIFTKNKDRFEDLMYEYNGKLNNKINEYIEKIKEEQKKQVQTRITEIINNSSNMTPDEISTEIYNAKKEISELTRNKLDVIDGYIEDNIKELLEDYSSKVPEKLSSQEIMNISKEYCKSIGNNIDSVKSSYANITRNEIENFYDEAKEEFENAKNAKDPKELGQTESVIEKEDGLAKNLEDNSKKPKKNVKISEVPTNIVDMKTLELFMNSFDEVKLTEENGNLIAKDSQNNEHDIYIKEDNNIKTIIFYPQNSFTAYGVNFDPESQSFCIKRGSAGLAYSMESNVLKVNTKENKYEFNFENTITTAYMINEKGEKVPIPENDIEKIIKEAASEGLDLTKSLNFAVDRSKGDSQRS